MAEKSEANPLELRIAELENQLEALLADESVDLSAEEVAAYKKVARAVACGRCGRGCAYCYVAAAGEEVAAAVPCACSCGRSCGRFCGYPCVVRECVAAAATEGEAASAVSCGRGCGRFCASRCIAAAATGEAVSASPTACVVSACVVACGRCGRGCGFCRPCIVAGPAGGPVEAASAVACECGYCGYCGYCYSSGSGEGPEGRVLGHAGVTPPVTRFGSLGK